MSFWTDLMGLPFTVQQVDVKGVSTRALVAGEGADLIFLHGISGHLEAFIPTLPEHAKHFKVHAIDMLGHGYTGKPGGNYGVDRIAQHVIDYMDVAGIAKAHVVGISLGGWVTAWLLTHHGHRLERSTMVLAAGKDEVVKPEILALIRKSTEAAVMSDDIAYTRKRMEQVIHDKAHVTDEIVDVRYKIYHLPEFRAGLENILSLTDIGNGDRFNITKSMLAEMDQEVLLAWSEEDAYSDVMGSQYWAANIKNNKLVIFKDAGHWPPFERPADFARVNLQFLRGGLAAVEAATI